MPNDKDFNLQEYIWNYFQLHAAQRLKTFEFYIVVATVLLSGYVVCIKEDNLMPIGIVVGVLLVLLSFVFWKLDVRNKQLIKNAEQALKTMEDIVISESTGGIPDSLKLFNYDDVKVEQRRHKKRSFLFHRHFSYSDCFGIMFIVFATLGIAAALWTCCCLLKPETQFLGGNIKPAIAVRESAVTDISALPAGNPKEQ